MQFHYFINNFPQSNYLKAVLEILTEDVRNRIDYSFPKPHLEGKQKPASRQYSA